VEKGSASMHGDQVVRLRADGFVGVSQTVAERRVRPARGGSCSDAAASAEVPAGRAWSARHPQQNQYKRSQVEHVMPRRQGLPGVAGGKELAQFDAPVPADQQNQRQPVDTDGGAS
jgi:hypothetical protein